MTRWEYAQLRGSYDEPSRTWSWTVEFPPDVRTSVSLGHAERMVLLNDYGAQGWDVAASSDVKTIRHLADGTGVEYATGVRYILRRPLGPVGQAQPG